ncbi:hypothetical protein [Acutalibacter sp. 1XD8-36]|uniref:hypothetical protein n=1 Tax=Acutalibacter sp. 1XD8-36 TaxID=2320852 RepID=UPI0014135C9A|nr:hypothetical protein [Acutalibacter sp. 1XD8-36]
MFEALEDSGVTLACVPLSWFFHSFPPRDYTQKKKHPVFTECFSIWRSQYRIALIQWATAWPTRTPGQQSKLWRGSYDSGMAGAEGFEPSARGFGVDVEKASTDIHQLVFRMVEPFVFPNGTHQKILMIY